MSEVSLGRIGVIEFTPGALGPYSAIILSQDI
jgi:hypothetical protein